MIKFFLSFLLIFLISLGCSDKPKKQTESKPKKVQTKDKETFQKDSKGIVKAVESTSIDGAWHCYKFEKDISEKVSYSKSYAVEYSMNASFLFHSDSIHVSETVGQPVYDYWHSTKKKGYDAENPFVLKFSPKEDSIQFIAQFNGSNVSDPFTLLMSYENNLIVRDRGYFFYFRKGPRLNKSSIKREGCAPDSRNFFKVEEKWGVANMNEAYKMFKEKYPYGAEKLSAILPKTPYFEIASGINYIINPGNIRITKQDENGSVIIEFKKSKTGVDMTYEIEYLEY